MQAVVTGCAGFVGSHLTDALLADGYRVVGADVLLDNYSPAIKRANLSEAQDFDDFTLRQLDLAVDDLADFASEADVIFHLAAEPGVRTSWGSHFPSYLRNNVLATQRVLEAVKSFRNARVVFASSSSVYGQSEQLPTQEDTLPRPFSPYGVTKLAAEHLCQLYYANYGIHATCLRYFSVFGPRQRPDMAFHRFCRAALEGTPLTVLGDGNQSRDFTFVSDIVDATIAAAKASIAPGEIYNIGAGAQISLNAAIGVLETVIGKTLDVRFVRKDYGDVAATGADIRKAQQDLAYAPSRGLGDGLRAEFEWIERNHQLLARSTR